MSYYFKSIEDKYNPLLSFKNPIVIKAKIKLDNRDIRLNAGTIKEIDFVIRKITKDISQEYKCLAFSTFNEINIIINDPKRLVENGKLEAHNLVSLFSQEIFMRYNNLSFNKKINFVSVNAFNVFEDKLKSYIYSRQSIGFNNYVSILGSKLFPHSQVKNKNREEILEIVEKISPSLMPIKKYIREGYASSNGLEVEIYKIKDFNNINSIETKSKSETLSQPTIILDDELYDDI